MIKISLVEPWDVSGKTVRVMNRGLFCENVIVYDVLFHALKLFLSIYFNNNSLHVHDFRDVEQCRT